MKKILVLNSGSSSLKYKLFLIPEMRVVCSGIVEAIGEEDSVIIDHKKAIEHAVEKLFESHSIKSLDEINAIGHRVVHGGDKFDTSVLIDAHVRADIASLVTLAPIHNRANLEGIDAMKHYLPNVPQVAVFDTAFHQSLSKEAYTYALPLELCQKEHIRRYGFHGTSHQYVAQQCAKQIGKALSDLNLITIHLGNGTSVCAIKSGKSFDTSMGFTPLEGLMMGTRCGDIDPSIVLYLQSNLDKDISEVENILNYQSGLKGISGSNDMRIIEKRAQEGDLEALLAIEMFTRSIKKYIGAYIALLGSVDGVVFTGGIGEHSATIRSKVIENMEHLNLILDLEKNLENEVLISTEKSPISIYVIGTNEEIMIAQECDKILF